MRGDGADIISFDGAQNVTSVQMYQVARILGKAAGDST